MFSSKQGSVSPRATALAAGTAALAAATAVWVRRKAQRAQRDHPPIGSFVDVDGIRLHFVEHGEGSPIVLLHGNTVLLQDFIASGLFDRLADGHRVVAFDRPGFGFSERPRDRLWTPSAQAALLERAFARLDIENPVVVGHSWGTLVALALAIEHPSSVRGLVLASGYYYPTARIDALLTAPVALPVLGDVLRHTVTALFARMVFRKMVETMFTPLPVAARFFELLSRELMLRPGQLRANAEAAALMVPAAARFQPQYRDLRLPVRIFAGERDRVVSPRTHAARLHGELPHSELTVFPHAGHMVHYAAPEQIAAAAASLSR
ncbi:MAG TPA: alpha/beta hydrolase [Burkholderiaceae bacterium]|nr:alpha/beta hydrolase [Burkholderiaceae bacterium]